MCLGTPFEVSRWPNQEVHIEGTLCADRWRVDGHADGQATRAQNLAEVVLVARSTLGSFSWLKAETK